MKFKVGDKVRVREWDDMQKEFGLDSSGEIKCRGRFVKSMRGLCGKVFKIASADFEYRLDGLTWTFFDDMLEPVCDAKIVITSDGKTTFARLYENGKVAKTAKAKCSPDDEFDFQIGAKTAFERLNSEDKPRGIKKAIMGAFYKVIGNSSPRHHFDIGDIVECTEIWESASRYYSEKADIGQYVSNDDVVLISKPEEKPKFFTGKVVCIKSEFPFWTVGKIYDIKDGDIVDDEGDMRCEIKSIKKFNEHTGGCEFIEIKE